MSQSSDETETDEEPEYPATDSVDSDLGVSAKSPKGAGRLLACQKESNSSALDVVTDLSKELDVLNQNETKCGTPQVIVSKHRACVVTITCPFVGQPCVRFVRHR